MRVDIYFKVMVFYEGGKRDCRYRPGEIFLMCIEYEIKSNENFKFLII